MLQCYGFSRFGLPARKAARIISADELTRTYGTQEVYYAGFQKLSKVGGRTVLADGRIVSLPEDAVFKERAAQWPYELVAKLVFPAVEVGAILDYEYILRWEAPWWHLPPWDFQSELPTRLSEITYITPPNLTLKPWGLELSRHPIGSEKQLAGSWNRSRYWSEELPGIHEEPHSLPDASLRSRVIMVPTSVRRQGRRVALFESWQSTCRLFAGGYRAVRRKDHQARKKARELAAREGSRLQKIAAVHAFVRDEIETDVPFGIHVAEGDKVHDALAAGRGRPVAKALLLQSMLAALDVDSDLVWVADRMAGRVHFDAVDILWFGAALVRVARDGEPLYLDPIDRCLGLGHIAPRYEGTQALIYHRSAPEIVELPSTPFAQNLSRVTVDLEIGDDGRAAGRGSFELEGHQAGRYLGKDAETVAVALRFLLARRFEGYEISDVEVEQDLRRRYVRLG